MHTYGTLGSIYINQVWNARECDTEENPDEAEDLVDGLQDALNDFAPDNGDVEFRVMDSHKHIFGV
jgi:hypothetical protein